MNYELKGLVHHDTKLSDIVIAEPTALTVLNRFGIYLGLGDLTVARACDKLGIDKDFLATILNTYLHESYFPERILASFRAATIVDYLGQTNNYYAQFQLPNIERHFNLLISKSDPSNNNLELMLRFFLEVKQQLLARIADDSNHWFPAILQAETKAAGSPPTPLKGEYPVLNTHCTFPLQVGLGGQNRIKEPEDTIEDKLGDLISMMVIHLQGDHDWNLALAVLMALANLKKDITQNNRIRNRLLRPIYQALSNA